MENCFLYVAPGANIQLSGNRACKGPAAYVNPGVQQGVGVVGDRHSVCSLILAAETNLGLLLKDKLNSSSLVSEVSFVFLCCKDKRRSLVSCLVAGQVKLFILHLCEGSVLPKLSYSSLVVYKSNTAVTLHESRQTWPCCLKKWSMDRSAELSHRQAGEGTECSGCYSTPVIVLPALES